MIYSCMICGWSYDEAVGYPEGDIAAGTVWDEVPEDFECPMCGASKSEFAQDK